MIFFIEYDRMKSDLVSIKTFEESQRHEAHTYRFNRELECFHQGIKQREIVLLEAASKSALHNTHRRYFNTLGQLAEHAAVVIAQLREHRTVTGKL